MPRYQRPVNMSYLSGKLKVLRPNSCISSFYSKNLYSNFAVGIHLPKDAYNQNFSPLAQTGAEISRWKSRHFFWIRSFHCDTRAFWYTLHSTTVWNLTKVWKTETGPLQGGRAWFGYPKSALFENLQNREPLATSQPAQPGRPNWLCWLAGG